MRWSEPAQLIAFASAACLVAALGAAWAIGHAHRRGMLDQPGERRSHVVATPRGGGIGMSLAGLGAIAWLSVDSGAASWWWIGAGLLLVSAIGWWDDHRPLPALPRLCVHAVAASMLGWAIHLSGADIAVAVAAMLLALVLVNAWNFMDGIDALAGSQALLCALGLAAVLGGPWQMLAVALAGACAGFLVFNLPPARVFMGDVGSGALGYLVAALLAGGFTGTAPAAWPLLLLPPLAILLDSGLTLAWRIRRGEAWWTPHVQHLYQRLNRRMGAGPVTGLYAFWTICATLMMLASHRWGAGFGLVPAGLIAMVGVVAWIRLHGRNDQ